MQIPGQIKREFIAYISERFGEAIKNLLETKHLYQRVDIWSDVHGFWLNRKPALPLGSFQLAVEALIEQLALERFTPSTNLVELVVGEAATELIPTIILKNAKMFCAACDAREAFHLVWSNDLGNELSKPGRFGSGMGAKLRPGLQLLHLAYQCQRCNGEPIGILLRRDGWQVSLHGRSPMEEIELPSFIPRPERHLFRDAVIAMHGGKVLAALFYLRAFIEQFARRITGIQGKETGDVIMDKYGATLPAIQRDSMPSLREWYGKLSEAIHATREDEKLFEAAMEAVETHFDFRRLFKIREPKTDSRPAMS